ncbi:hypothetical protein BWI97_07265 [Siphonobacter sp. BAB-5405]|uniref:hypothetical protein n=1 Tax=Siphonobacter sp. BAB-5405 TaxID=1864825 RepID=UPI000C80896D|nr:hypothetical protein [Siphonobacter sp. BAB-5405]PMD97422.1 hypothetical protein BWI97_07265 [Siphonobacter sp. BAB-5405]
MTTLEKAYLDRILQLARDTRQPAEYFVLPLNELLVSAEFRVTNYKLDPMPVYRAQSYTAKGLEEVQKEFSHPKRFSYPCKNILERFCKPGRCNTLKKPVFYGSDDSAIGVFEIRPEKGDYVVRSIFAPKENSTDELHLVTLGYNKIVESLGQHESKSGILKMLRDDPMRFTSQRQHTNALDNYMSEWFLKEVNDENRYYYKLTTALYELYVNSTYDNTGRKFDGIIYPSVAGRFSGVNLAFETNYVDRNLELVDAVIYQVEDVLPGDNLRLRVYSKIDSIINDMVTWMDADDIGKIWDFCPDTPVVYS